MANAETQLASYFAKYEPAMAKLGKALRAKLRARLPGLFEIVYVYENQNALVIAYSPTERGYEGVCTISVYPRLVRLGFGRAPSCRSRTRTSCCKVRARLCGTSRLNSVADFDRPEIESLIADAVKLAKLRLDRNAKGAIIIKAEAQKQRARRATKAARPASTRRVKMRQSKKTGRDRLTGMPRHS